MLVAAPDLPQVAKVFKFTTYKKNRLRLLNRVDRFAENLKKELFPTSKKQVKCLNVGCVGLLTKNIPLVVSITNGMDKYSSILT